MWKMRAVEPLELRTTSRSLKKYAMRLISTPKVAERLPLVAEMRTIEPSDALVHQRGL